MAIYSPGPAVGSISGNLGGVSFANPRGSPVIRKARRPSPANAPAQRTAQTRLLIVKNAWLGLSADNQKAWRTYATNTPSSNRLGVSRQITGFQIFLKIHLTRFNFNTTILTDPPVNFTRQPIHSFSLVSSISTGIDVLFTDDNPTSGRTAYAYGRPLFRVTLPSSNNTWTFLGLVITTFDEWPLESAWEQKFSLPILDQAIAIRVVPAIGPAFVPSTPIDLFALTTA